MMNGEFYEDCLAIITDGKNAGDVVRCTEEYCETHYIENGETFPANEPAWWIELINSNDKPAKGTSGFFCEESRMKKIYGYVLSTGTPIYSRGDLVLEDDQ